MLYSSQLNNILIHSIVLLGICFANYDMCLYTYLYMCIHALVRVDDAEVWVSCARCEPITGGFDLHLEHGSRRIPATSILSGVYTFVVYLFLVMFT